MSREGIAGREERVPLVTTESHRSGVRETRHARAIFCCQPTAEKDCHLKRNQKKPSALDVARSMFDARSFL